MPSKQAAPSYWSSSNQAAPSYWSSSNQAARSYWSPTKQALPSYWLAVLPRALAPLTALLAALKKYLVAVAAASSVLATLRLTPAAETVSGGVWAVRPIGRREIVFLYDGLRQGEASLALRIQNKTKIVKRKKIMFQILF